MGLPKENRFVGASKRGKDGQAIDENLAKQLMLREIKYKTKHDVSLKHQLFLF